MLGVSAFLNQQAARAEVREEVGDETYESAKKTRKSYGYEPPGMAGGQIRSRIWVIALSNLAREYTVS